jgi:hypothetical protein
VHELHPIVADELGAAIMQDLRFPSQSWATRQGIQRALHGPLYGIRLGGGQQEFAMHEIATVGIQDVLTA